MLKRIITISICLAFPFCLFGGNKIYEQKIRNLFKEMHKYTEDGDLINYLLCSVGSKDDLRGCVLGFSCMRSFIKFKNTLVERKGKDAWAEYRKSKKDTWTLEMSMPLPGQIEKITKTEEKKYEVYFKGESLPISVIKKGQDFYIDLSSFENRNNWVMLLSMKEKFDRATALLKENDYSIDDVRKSMMLAGGNQKVRIPFYLKDGVYLITQNRYIARTENKKTTQYMARSSYAAAFSKLMNNNKGTQYKANVYEMENYSFTDNSLPNFSFTVTIDEYGNVTSFTPDKSLSNDQEYAAILIMGQTFSFLPATSNQLCPKQIWSIPPQAYEKELPGENHHLSPCSLFQIDGLCLKGKVEIASLQGDRIVKNKKLDNGTVVSGIWRRNMEIELDSGEVLSNTTSIKSVFKSEGENIEIIMNINISKAYIGSIKDFETVIKQYSLK